MSGSDAELRNVYTQRAVLRLSISPAAPNLNISFDKGDKGCFRRATVIVEVG